MSTLQVKEDFSERRTTGSVKPRRTNRIEELQGQIERLKERARLAVIFGGDKRADGAVINPTVNPRSWKSYQSVALDIQITKADLNGRR